MTPSTTPLPPPAPIWRPAIVLFVLLSLLTGLGYPLLVTGLAQWSFPEAARGSLIERDGRIVGSALIGQTFVAPQYFWGRPSATAPAPYNAGASTGSNLGPTNPALLEAVQARIAALRAADPDNPLPIPVDLVTASASGLDPHVSRAAADYQVARVARSRGWTRERVAALVEQYTAWPVLGVFGEPRVDVLGLNLALDRP